MRKFMDEDFLLETETAKKLFHEHAQKKIGRASCRERV